MRIADLDTSRRDDCPTGWTLITTPVAACIAPSSNAGCYSTNFSTLSIPYSRVCGMAVGYQMDGTDAFAGIHFFSRSINGPYVDGVSITYGTPRKHKWTYAIGFSDSNQPCNASNCPCSQFPGSFPPSFVNDNYYCEPGSSIDDPVWDGKGCSTDNSCCSNPSLPWFYRQIPLTTTEDIETRICHDDVSSDEDILVEKFKLYVQ